MAAVLMQAARGHRVPIRVTLHWGDAVNLEAYRVELEDGALILRSGDLTVQTAFSPTSWAEVNRR